MGDDIAGFLEALDIPSSHVAGISDGGVLALDLALLHPEAVRSMTVIGTNFCVDERTSARLPDSNPRPSRRPLRLPRPSSRPATIRRTIRVTGRT